ncbi:MAG: preprotein translocase subunit SecG [Cyclobacteriaceae bacterium]
MFGLIISLALIVAVLLILVVLAQNPKGGGLSSQFGGQGASQIMGVKKTTDFLEKATWFLAIFLMVLAMSSKFAFTPEQGGFTSPAIEKAQEQNLLPSIDDLQEGLGDELEQEDNALPLNDSVE